MPPSPMTGMLTALRRFVHHAQRDRLDRRPRQAACYIGQPWLTCFHINRHRKKGIHQAHGIRPCRRTYPRHGSDGSDIGRELHHQRPLRNVLDLVHQVFQRTGIGTERHAAGMHIGAGDIQFVSRDAIGVVQSFDHLFVFAYRIAEYVDDNFAGGIAASAVEASSR